MILTNKLGLPRSIENAVRNDPYSRGNAHISVTGMIGPARKRALEIKHADQITEDVAERIWSLWGQIGHGILERADDATLALTEKRLFIERHGWRISGSFDRYVLVDTCLQDYKFSSTYSIKDGPKIEWVAQENIYALLLQVHGYEVSRLEIVALLRDWQKSRSRNTVNYPKQPVVIVPVEMWSEDQTEAYIRSRLIAHGKAQHELPECSPEERWAKPPVFALQRLGTTRAKSLHDTYDEAERARNSLPERDFRDYTISERPGEQRRCADYCPVLEFCSQGQELLKGAEDFKLSQLWAVTGKQVA